ncbi:hypothetical protein S7711_04979 [Stachybotrys chartarum IBT 7711]|uniref:Palmitoyltransferase n=1 Tax=Stachybotrys chartarum (strain CBS 109288 / IBT 7711) TaxID=1280523 RepID=A0A084ARB3_STACB|nr:hypothetical protein S7711_04979 [Stachybotrys chartarum IBT 7711]KFA47920.1 hypothetical protein S40293_05150 [Stachybotrys chartarum IBT 40293]KFA79878.1 hypothetical protein S40288_03777 [Stachybotrys chartarum IBT 40288]
MAFRWARKVERACCSCIRFLPLVFVYSLTSWAAWVVVEIGRDSRRSKWVGPTSSVIGVALFVLLNWSYTTAVFTPPGSTTNDNGYGLLPTSQSTPVASSLTVKSNGETRFCKKCQARKPDRAHHCSTCRRCVLKMDHHCPWLATCIGLRNHKAFLLFLVYTTVFCLYSFAISGSWVWAEIIDDVQNVESLLPVNFIMLSVISGIIGLVVGAFTIWHIILASKGQTTIECLEKTRYLSPLKATYMHAHNPANHVPQAAQQLVDMHTNILPGVTRPEEGETQLASSYPANEARPVHMSYQQVERQNAQKRYDEYLDEQDSEKLPNAFDLGWKRNLLHLLGPSPLLWFVPICNTTGDGWAWEASPKWLEARERLRREREEQRMREVNAGWGGPGADDAPVSVTIETTTAPKKSASKADRVLGRDPNLYADDTQGYPMRRLSPRGRTIEEELDELDAEEDNDHDDGQAAGGGLLTGSASTPVSREEAERRAMDVVTNGGGWGRSGASGMLRKGSAQSAGSLGRGSAAKPQYQDDGVD